MWAEEKLASNWRGARGGGGMSPSEKKVLTRICGPFETGVTRRRLRREPVPSITTGGHDDNLTEDFPWGGGKRKRRAGRGNSGKRGESQTHWAT